MYSGITGALKIVNSLGVDVPIAYISGWSIEDKTDIISKTKLGCADKEAFAGYQSWSASADGAVVFDGIGSHEDLFLAKYNGTKVTLHFYLKDGAIDGSEKNTYFCGEGYIESLSVDLSAEDKGNISISISGTGPLELYVDDINVMTNEEHKIKEYIKFKVEDDGHMYVIVPDEFKDDIKIDDNGYLVLML